MKRLNKRLLKKSITNTFTMYAISRKRPELRFIEKCPKWLFRFQIDPATGLPK